MERDPFSRSLIQQRANAHYQRGLAYELTGRKVLARAQYAKATELDPDGQAARNAREKLRGLADGASRE